VLLIAPVLVPLRVLVLMLVKVRNRLWALEMRLVGLLSTQGEAVLLLQVLLLA
jgi:hypothetical protein